MNKERASIHEARRLGSRAAVREVRGSEALQCAAGRKRRAWQQQQSRRELFLGSGAAVAARQGAQAEAGW